MCRALCGPSHAGQEAEVEAFAPGEEAGRPAVTERSRPRPAGIGRLERRLFTLDLLRSPALRHKIQTSLNKGKASNNLRKAVFFHRLGQIRDRAYENQQYRSQLLPDQLGMVSQAEGPLPTDRPGRCRAGAAPPLHRLDHEADAHLVAGCRDPSTRTGRHPLHHP